ncbi:acyl-CoA thioester hydrolase [Pseudomonas delhiensis]|uniref:Acyl-CoA thioester hydrolase n=1 Tax=Pseudomonas delhiensis TaxID=366289 RepID=A0A239I2D2_9PSED|nr:MULTISPECIES: thioesterase family protein [Pseudomonas]PWU29684.1 4-hydroxybenzoyl-CoA thioesterase [Pseudomonas sp. RW407]SDJ60512.1 acyl-CoA thioester hydrolase [Pseudomonas delhiensis]SNS87755.1 acyl-CoA thioester hydrolase [Pseudomonas delhiensis]
MLTYRTPVLRDWIDYNEHLRDAFYLLIFSYATDALMERIGLDEAGRADTGHTLFTLEAHINYLAQAKLGDALEVRTRFIDRDLKRLHIVHDLHREGSDEPLAVSEQMLMNVDFQAGRACVFADAVDRRVSELFRQYQGARHPGYCGRRIAIRR